MNEIMTVEIHHHVDEWSDHEFFNFRVKNIRRISERQRMNFKSDGQSTNISEMKFLLKELKEKLKDVMTK